MLPEFLQPAHKAKVLFVGFDSLCLFFFHCVPSSFQLYPRPDNILEFSDIFLHPEAVLLVKFILECKKRETYIKNARNRVIFEDMLMPCETKKR